MGTHVVQCWDCGKWNWEGIERCSACKSENLDIGFHQFLNTPSTVIKVAIINERRLENIKQES